MKRLLFAVVALVCLTVSAFGANVSLPVASFDGYSTSVVYVNATDEPIPVPGVCQISPCLQVGAKSVKKVRFYESGVATIDVPDGLVAYAEITDPRGLVVRVDDIGAEITDADLYDFEQGGDWRSFLVLYSDEGTGVTLTFFDNAEPVGASQVLIPAGSPQVVEFPVGANRVEASAGFAGIGCPGCDGTFRVFGLMSHQPYGELLVVLPLVSGVSL